MNAKQWYQPPMAFLASPPELSAAVGVGSSKHLSNPNLIDCWNNNIVAVSNRRNRFGAGGRARFAVCSGIKECDVRGSGLDRNVVMYGEFCAVVKPDSMKSREEEEAEKKKQDYYVNLGYAIRTLREEFPELFYRELNPVIYRDDIVFKDPMNTFVGLENYKSIFWALRFHGRIFFRALWVDIISVWQPAENVIMVRWAIHGIPRVPWESRGRFDGTSEYKLDIDGKIYEHRVDNIAINSPPKFHMLGVQELIQSLGCPSNAKPTYFELSSSSVLSFSDERREVNNE